MSTPVISQAGLARRYPRARPATAAGLLAAACVAWAALASRTAGPGTAFLVLAIACAALSTARLAAGGAGPAPAVYYATLARVGFTLLAALRAVPWAEGLVIAVLALEATHHARPYHTGLLGAGLLAYLFATHLTESAARPRVLAPQLPLLAAGLGLLILAIGASSLATPAGPTSAWLRVITVVAAVLAGALAVPV